MKMFTFPGNIQTYRLEHTHAFIIMQDRIYEKSFRHMYFINLYYRQMMVYENNYFNV